MSVAPIKERWLSAVTFRCSTRIGWLLGFAVFCALALVGRAGDAAPKPPDRRELWVPVDKIAGVLDEKAVLLTREQYETLLRDAGLDKAVKPELPTGVVLSNAVCRAAPDGKTAVIHAELLVEVLQDGWNELPLEFPGAAVGEVKLDGEGVLAPNAALPPPAGKAAKGKIEAPPRRHPLLMIRGRGKHRISLELAAPIQSAAGLNSFALSVPNVATGTFTLTLPAGASVEKLGAAVKVTTSPDATTATTFLSPSQRAVAFVWKNAAAAGAAQAPVKAEARARYSIDAEKATGSFAFRLEAVLGDLPAEFEFSLPAGVKILSVRAEELRGWEAAGGKVMVMLQLGERKLVELELETELPSLAGKDAAPLALPLPLLKGVPRMDGILVLNANEDVIVKDVAGDSALRRVPTAGDRGERGFFGVFGFTARATAPRLTVERALPRLEADLDTLVEFRSDAIFLNRTVTLREQKGRRFSATIALPAEEELIVVRRIEEGSKESEPEWTREAGKVLIKWSDESAKPRVFRLRTRVEPEKWTQMPSDGVAFTLNDAKIADAAKVAGYIALTADPAFRIEAQAGETLERGDGRFTPVRGEYAWSRRDAFDLKVKIARRPAEVLAALTGYALPLEGVLDLHASMNYQFMGGGSRSVRIRVPADLAQNFHFDGPQIAERALDGDVWTITFQKELTGAYELAITAQVPVAKQAGDGKDGAKGYSFAVKVPVISPLDVVRASGLWAVEANTETEIRFDATGMNELDTLLAPQIAGYAPRHRIIGVFGWLGPDYALALNGVRHAAAGMLSAIVDLLELTTVASTSGLHRHKARYHTRAAGVEYLDVALPPGAQLLSVALDATAVKPVADRPGSVRIPLPARRETDTPVVASIVYETPAAAWKSRGTLALAAPSLAKEIPVLKSTWRVWVPDGFSFSEFESNLPVPDVVPEELLLKRSAKAVGSLLFKKKREAFVSSGRLLVSAPIRPDGGTATYGEEVVNFFETQIELMQSNEVRRRAHARVHSLHPDLPPEDVKVEVAMDPKSSIARLKVTGASAGYAQAYLDAVMDEYSATKKEMRGVSPAAVIANELVRIEKEMKQEEEEMHEFQKQNNIGFLREDGNSAGVYLAGLNRQLADLKAEFARLEPQQSDQAIRTRRESLRLQIENLQGVIKQWEAKALEISRRIAEFDKLKSKIDRSKATYDRLLTSIRSLDVSKGLEQEPVSILERATPAKRTMVADDEVTGRQLADSAVNVVEGQIRTSAALPNDAWASQPGVVRARPPQSGEKSELDGFDKDDRADGPSTAQITKKLNSIIIPKIDFKDSTVREAVDFLVKKVKDLDPENRGVSMVLKLGDEAGTPAPAPAVPGLPVPAVPGIPGLEAAPGVPPSPAGIPAIGGGSGTRITLTLNNVPFIEAIKYITNLANLKYKIEPYGISIVPLGTQAEGLAIREWKASPGKKLEQSAKGWLTAAGVVFGPGTFANYDPASGSLIVKNTPEQLEVVERFIQNAGGWTASVEHFYDYQSGRKTAGLLPVKLYLPKTGRAIVFDGLYAPERLVMRYDDWWSRAQRLWMWFVGGGIVFYLFARRRPWWRTLWAVLVLSAVPLCVSVAWMPVCNAVLGGWLAGLVLNRIGAWCVFRVRKEVLA